MMGDLLGSFSKKRASEDKARWKDSCWFAGPVVIPGSNHSDVGRYRLLVEWPPVFQVNSVPL